MAARLAEVGYTVLVLEAGGEPSSLTRSDPLHRGQNTAREDYEVPAFHGLATENDAFKWDFSWATTPMTRSSRRRIRRYVEDYLGKRVASAIREPAPSAGEVTAHNALIFVHPQNTDWNELADLTGDQTWCAESMRHYFERLEHCDHRPFQRFLSRFGVNPTRHGWGGWLHNQKTQPVDAIRDRRARHAGHLFQLAAQSTTKEPLLNTEGLLDLTTECATAFNLVTPDVLGVRYIAIASDAARADHRLLLVDLAQLLGDLTHERNDGVVTRRSALRPGFEKFEDWPTDHAVEVGWTLPLSAGARRSPDARFHTPPFRVV